MHLLYADETSLDPARHEFFVYGGVAIPCANALELHRAFESLRAELQIPEDFHIKFNPGPQHLDHSAFISLKRRLIKLASDAGCTLLTTIIHHKILKSVEEARRCEINRIAFHFNSLLNGLDDCGLVLIDRFSDSQIDAHLREKFSIGLTGMPYSEKMRLERILGFHYSAIGQSHFASLIDVLIGSMRFVIDAFSTGEESKLTTARTMLAQMAPLFIKTANNEVSVFSINFTPKTIKVDAYRTRYQALKEFLGLGGLPLEQEITEYRTY